MQKLRSTFQSLIPYLSWGFSLLIVTILILEHPSLFRSFEENPNWALLRWFAIFNILGNAFQGLRFLCIWPRRGLSLTRAILSPFVWHSVNILLPFRGGEAVFPVLLRKWDPEATFKEAYSWILVDKVIEAVTLAPFIFLASYYLNFSMTATTLLLCAMIIPFTFWTLKISDRPLAIIAAVFFSIASWLCNAAMYWVVFQDLKATSGVLVSTSLGSAIPGFPASIGSFEYAFLWMTKKLSLPNAEMIKLAISTHGVSILSTLLIGFPAAAFWGFPDKEERIQGILKKQPLTHKLTNLFTYASAIVTLLAAGLPWSKIKTRNAGKKRKGSKLRIALVSEFFYPTVGGVQEHLYNFAKSLIKEGHTVRIITPRVLTTKRFEAWWPHDLPKEVYLPIGTSLRFYVNDSLGRGTVGPLVGRRLKKLLTPENFDIVHLHAPLNGSLPIIAAHMCTTHLVGTFHTSFPSSKQLELLKSAGQTQINKIETIIGVSPNAIESIGKFFKFESEIIPNGIDTEYFYPQWMDPKRKNRRTDPRLNIFWIGRPDPRNGLDALLIAYKSLLKKYPHSLKLIIAGGGEEMLRYEAAARTLPAGSYEFVGRVRDERDEYYRTADIHVFPVEKATFSITLLEGMATGLPVVTCDFDGVEAIGTPGEHLLTCKFDHPSSLEKALIQFIEDPKMREKFGKRARERAEEFDWRIIAQKVERVYRRVLEKSASTD